MMWYLQLIAGEPQLPITASIRNKGLLEIIKIAITYMNYNEIAYTGICNHNCVKLGANFWAYHKFGRIPDTLN